MDNNLSTYSSKKVVSYYEKYNTLQKPEQEIFSLLKNELSQMEMLDIGIGAGRTTEFFCPQVKKYVGIDYSQEMVNSCINRFGKKFDKASFLCEDARTLSAFKDESFDFVLFSFNGIDYVLPEERDQIITQINRVLRPGGLFCFSSHNISSLSDMPFFELRLNIPAAIKRAFEVRKIKSINKRQLAMADTADYVIINDGAHNYGLQTFYVRQSYQLKQLANHGFSNTKAFALTTGEEITGNRDTKKEKWLYYLCRKN
jgi:ubiquinone/menaquinone biosynthesis C-methylase UbiE